MNGKFIAPVMAELQATQRKTIGRLTAALCLQQAAAAAELEKIAQAKRPDAGGHPIQG